MREVELGLWLGGAWELINYVKEATGGVDVTVGVLSGSMSKWIPIVYPVGASSSAETRGYRTH